MLTNKIAALCRKEKSILITRSGKTQWVGNGAAIYPLYKFPKIDDDSLCAIFDISEKKRENMCIRTLDIAPIDISDNCDNEIEIEKRNTTTVLGKSEMQSFFTGEKLIFIDSHFLTPLSDISEELGYYLRYSNKQMYIVVKLGMIPLAAIMPFKVNFNEIIKSTEEYLKLLYLSRDNSIEVAPQMESDTQIRFADEGDI